MGVVDNYLNSINNKLANKRLGLNLKTDELAEKLGFLLTKYNKDCNECKM